MKLFIDYESYYDKEYSLKKMTPVEYILDKRWECHGVSVLENGTEGNGWWCDAEDIPKYFATLNPKKTIIFTFNALFDMAITLWKYNFDPLMMLDVLGMSRALRGHLFRNHSLSSVAKGLGLPAKGDTINKVCGMHTAEIKANPELWAEFKAYALLDNSICAGIAENLLPEFPMSEMKVMDMVLRACVQPQLKFNRRKLVLYRKKMLHDKRNLITTAKVDKKTLMSAIKFAAAVEKLGVDIVYKQGKNGLIPAVAKTDDFMAYLQDHEDERVRALACARLGIRSTLEVTRAKRYGRIARMPAAYHYAAGSCPVALRYGAAHTGRLGGEWKLNFQNMTRGSALRDAIEAWRLEEWEALGYDKLEWPGDMIMAPDYAQIEARMVAYLAKQQNMIRMFANKEDVYAAFASMVFGFPVVRSVHKIEGFIGKTGVLGLSYGAGVSKFHYMVHLLARTQLGRDIEFSMEDAERVVRVYRKEMFPDVPKLWRDFGLIIQDLSVDPRDDVWHQQFPMLHFEHQAIVLPNGMKLRYYNLRKDPATEEWLYDFGKETHKIYGAKAVENVSQALTRIIAMHAGVRCRDRGFRMALQAHDELGYPTKASDAKKSLMIVNEEMTRVPSWAPGFPLGLAMKIGPTYGKASEKAAERILNDLPVTW